MTKRHQIVDVEFRSLVVIDVAPLPMGRTVWKWSSPRFRRIRWQMRRYASLRFMKSTVSFGVVEKIYMVTSSVAFNGLPPDMTRCKQRARLLPTHFLDIFFPIDPYFFAPLQFPHSCRIQTHSSTTTSDHRQVVLNVWWPKNCQKSL